jgi:GcrA cell cycle regulator
MTGYGAVWSQAKIDTLLALWNEGKSAAVIGAEMGISRNAVIGRIYRLRRAGAEIKAHESERPEKLISLWHTGKSTKDIGDELGMSSGAVKNLAYRLRRKGVPLKHHTRPSVPQVRMREAVVYLPKPKPLPTIVDTLEGSVALPELTGCKWVVTPTGPHRFCNREKLDSSPYCEAHAVRAIQPREMKRGKYERAFG